MPETVTYKTENSKIHCARYMHACKKWPPGHPERVARQRLMYLSLLIHYSREAAQHSPLTPDEAAMVAQLVESGARDDT